MKLVIFYVDPQSYNNLAVYDENLLSNMTSSDIYFYGNTQYEGHLYSHIKFKPIFEYSSKKNFVAKGISYCLSIYKLIKDIKTIHPDVVHIQWLRIWIIDFLLIKWLKHKGIKTVFTAHNILPHDSGEKYKNKYIKYYNEIDHIIVHSEFTEKELTKLIGSKNKVSVVPHGILKFNLNIPDLNSRISFLKNYYNIKDEIIFSSLGVQSYYKGTDLIINAWKSNKNLYLNNKCKLFLIGKSNNIDYSDILEFQNVIVIDEKLCDLDFQAWFILSSIILLPYREISQSGVLFNALALNKPVLVSDAGGLKEPLKYGNVGWNIGKANAESLQKFFLHILDNPDLITQMNNRTEDFEKVKSIYSWDAISIKTQEVYKKILNKS